MNKIIEHISHKRVMSEDCSFYICNIFKLKAKKIELNDIFKFDLINEKYFHTEEQLIEMAKGWETLSTNQKNNSKKIIIDPYGPIKRSTINSNDFVKLNYEEYTLKMKLIIENWRKIEDGFEDDLEKFHLKSINDLQNFNLEKRDYYFFNSQSIEDSRKHELSFIYSYFFTVIGIDTESNTFIILNFGNE